jgi:tRNA(fMet)-specific endonuclease VapC
VTLYLLDTNIVSYVVRGRSPAARAALAGLRDNEVGCISAITEAEIRDGLAKNPSVRLRFWLDHFLNRLRVLSWGRDEAIVYGNVRANLERMGRTLENMDLLIAAHAISVGAVLVTNDQSFAQVEDLHAMVNWATDV